MLYGKSQQEIDAKKTALMSQLQELEKHYQNNAMLLRLGFVLTCILYFVFNKHLYLGDATTWARYFTEWHTALDFGLTFVIVCLMAYFLAWVKHQAYIYFGFFGSIAAILITVIGFALFAEFFSTSASQDIKSRLLLEGDKEYQTVINTNVANNSVVTNPRLSDFYAQLEKAKQAAKGCKSGCAGHDKKIADLQGRIKGEEASLNAALSAKSDTDVRLQQLNNERADKLKADSYNPAIVSVAKMIAALFGGSYIDYIKTATVLITLFVAICFETLHHFLSKDREKTRLAIESLKMELAKLEGVDISDYQPTKNKREAKIAEEDLGKDSGFKSTGIGFTANIGKPKQPDLKPSSAELSNSPALFKYQSGDKADLKVNRLTPMPVITYRDSLTDRNAPIKDLPLDSVLADDASVTRKQATRANSASNPSADRAGSANTLQPTVLQPAVGSAGNPGANNPSASSANRASNTSASSADTLTPDMLERFKQAQLAKCKSAVQCPNCGTTFIKSNAQHLFCSRNRKPRADGGNCSDEWHNQLNPERQKFIDAKKKRISN